MINRLTESLDFHGQALVLRAERQRVIASNIANADTPGYKARDFDFAAALRSATSRSATSRSATSGNAMSGSATVGSNIGHDIAADVMAGASVGGAATARLRYAVPGQTHLDNNTVDMDRERAAFMDNAVKFESTLRFVNGNVRTMLDAMKSPNQG